MMPSPAAIYEELKTKSNEEVLKEIKRFKRQISQLKKELELPLSDDYIFIRPSPDTQIWCIRQYINESKKLLHERGIECTPSKAEQRALEFDNKLSELVEISVVREGFFNGCHEYVVACGEEFQMVTYHDKFQHDLLVDYLPNFIRLNKDSFVAELQELHIGEWKSNYYTCACDGEQWEIVFKFNDGTKRINKGSNAYPYNFDDLMDLLRISNGDDDDDDE